MSFFATITADEQRLYFVSDRSGGLGGKDIWCSNKLHNGEWGKAINMGAPINTGRRWKDAPIPSSRWEKQCIFHPMDISLWVDMIFFYSQFENNEWTSPTNLGYPIKHKRMMTKVTSVRQTEIGLTIHVKVLIQ